MSTETAPATDSDRLIESPAGEIALCQRAADSRRRYVRALIAGRHPLDRGMRAALAAHVARLAVITNEVLGSCDLLVYAWWLGLAGDRYTDRPAEHDLDDSHLEALIRQVIATSPDPHRQLLAAIAADAEQSLHRPEAWRPASLRPTGYSADAGLGTGAWLDLVGGALRYCWTPWESAQLRAAQLNEPSNPSPFRPTP